ncbi:hypothetical protein BaRGS_00036796 [Batillaria attramentaria]|uniref:Uncharacterized protein n=1 Tax=Batillaria attramentaria TaxID=370345 RepID=A0ABD0JAW2_9CAEN
MNVVAISKTDKTAPQPCSKRTLSFHLLTEDDARRWYNVPLEGFFSVDITQVSLVRLLQPLPVDRVSFSPEPLILIVSVGAASLTEASGSRACKHVYQCLLLADAAFTWCIFVFVGTAVDTTGDGGRSHT